LTSKLEKINFGAHEEEVKRIWNGEPPTSLVEFWQKQGLARKFRNYNPGTMKSRYARIQKLLGYGSNCAGHCSICSNFNSHILKQKIDGAIIITRFCSEHIPKVI
jgi:hypothetical protein